MIDLRILPIGLNMLDRILSKIRESLTQYRIVCFWTSCLESSKNIQQSGDSNIRSNVDYLEEVTQMSCQLKWVE